MIVLGTNRGYIHYQGQPKLCRRCGEHGHLVDTCEKAFCGKCREVGHIFEQCTNQRKCNLCGKEDHLFRDCPKSFANKLKKKEGTKQGPNVCVIERVDELIEKTRLENSNLPPRPVIEGDEQVVVGTGEGLALLPQTETAGEEDMQVEGGVISEGEETDLGENKEDDTLPDAQLAKRPASELSPNMSVVSEKRVRLGNLSENSPEEEPRVFPADSPNEVSFLNVVLQSTPKAISLDKTLQQRPTPRTRKVNGAQPCPLSPFELKEELHSQEIT